MAHRLFNKRVQRGCGIIIQVDHSVPILGLCTLKDKKNNRGPPFIFCKKTKRDCELKNIKKISTCYIVVNFSNKG
ncbi:MAG: hypothetical protein EBZ47_09270 [Chlamydiae bacterium]|nr:hypothetical protein [Chlamydiota bacterium]